MLVDTHSHLNCPSLLARLDDVLSAARKSDVSKIIVPSVGPEDWETVKALASETDGIFVAFGVHPMRAHLCTDDNVDRLSLFSEKAVAIGEIGLDYVLPNPPRDQQIPAFRKQLRAAVEIGLPVLIHCRKAFSDLIRILKEENVQRVGGVMHAFSGSYETAMECITLGLSISICGTVTYRNAVKPVSLVQRLSLDHLVLETDSPDMTPEPHRGIENEPAFLRYTLRKAAEIRGTDPEEVAAVTTRNAERLFRIDTVTG